ncbi:MAG: GNAT family N-acetyltransferase, partial [Streptosporangiaceae bacterium]
RVRMDERRVAAMGLRAHVVAAHAQAPGGLAVQAPGGLAALTQLTVDPAMPEWGFQELTAVARPHRGHRLGLLLKLAMLDLLAGSEPQLTQIITRNAAGNDHMIAINDQLGFEMLGQWLSWELDVAGLPPGPAGDG